MRKDAISARKKTELRESGASNVERKQNADTADFSFDDAPFDGFSDGYADDRYSSYGSAFSDAERYYTGEFGADLVSRLDRAGRYETADDAVSELDALGDVSDDPYYISYDKPDDKPKDASVPRKKKGKLRRGINRAVTKLFSGRSSKTKKRAMQRLALAAAALFVVALTFAALAGAGGGDTPAIANGITINGHDVSGMTSDEAYTMLRNELDRKLAATGITLTRAGESWTLDNIELGIGDDLESVIDRAMTFGNDDGFALFKKDPGADLTVTVTIDEVTLRTTLAQICGITDEPVVEGSVTYDPLAANAAGLFTITTPRSGRKTDMTSLISEIRRAVRSGGDHVIAVTEVSVQPKHTLSELKLSVTPIAETSISLAGTDDSFRANAEKASLLLNGAVIEPGDVLSFREAMGDMSVDSGFVSSYELASDGSRTESVGAGVCLAASAFYRAALLADLDIVSRVPHEIAQSYTEAGLDASIDGENDLAVKNSGAYPVYIHTGSDGATLTIVIYGMAFADGASIETGCEILSYTDAPKPVEITDDTGAYSAEIALSGYADAVKSERGCVVRSYRIYYDKFMNVIEKQSISKDSYLPVTGIRMVAHE